MLPISPEENLRHQRECNQIGANVAIYNHFTKQAALGMISVAKTLPEPPSTILDIGCRHGIAIEEFERAFPAAEIHGLDLVPEFLDEAARVCDNLHLGDMTSLPFPDKSIDWIFCCQALEHSTDIPKAIAEACRVARVGLYYSVPLEYDTEKNRTQNPSHHLFEPNPIKWLDFWLPHPDWTLYTVGRINRGFYLLLCLLAADLKPASTGD